MSIGNQATTNKPKIFISYSHTSMDHIQWVVEFATRLSHDGVLVVLDKWDLKPGADAIMFMEQMVTDESIEFVLLVCDQRYKVKADARDGGVGTESQIVSQAVYGRVKQEKFIPVITEFDVDGKPCHPVFAAGRMYINLSAPEIYEAEYDRLIRHLWKRPLHKRPTVGEMPEHLKDDLPESSPLLGKVRRAGALLDAGNPKAQIAVRQTFSTMIGELRAMKISYSDSPSDYDERVVSTLALMTPIRDAFIELVLSAGEAEGFADHVHQFFEDLICLFYPTSGTQSHNSLDCDNFRFFGYEVLLCYLAILIKNGHFKVASDFLASSFFKRKYEQLEATDIYREFHTNIASLDKLRNERLKLNRASVVADELKRRATNVNVTFQEIQTADCVLFAKSLLGRDAFRFWWPVTMVFNDFRGSAPDLFVKMVSKRHFEKVKLLYGGVNPDQLRKGINEANDRLKQSGISYGFESRWIPSLDGLFDPANLGTLP